MEGEGVRYSDGWANSGGWANSEGGVMVLIGRKRDSVIYWFAIRRPR